MCRLPLLLGLVLLGPGCRYELELPFLVDDSFEDFSAGTLPDGGAKIYVSARGNVQLIDRLDLDGDGWPDLAFAPYHDNKDFQQPATILLSSPKAPHDFAAPRQLTLPTRSGEFLTGADLDDDGWTDLFISNSQDALSSRVGSYLYQGSASGLSAERRLELPTVGAFSSVFADLNRDGYLDLVVCNNFDKGQAPLFNLSSYVYWGSKSGLSDKNRLSLPVTGGAGVVAADLDEDGRLDLVLSSLDRDVAGDDPVAQRTTESLIYWGAASGFEGPARLPSFGGIDVGVGDLDRDGALDLVILNRGLLKQLTATAWIYWGDRSDRRGYGVARRSELPIPVGHGFSIGDLDGDGSLDLVFSSAGVWGSGVQFDSLIYWGPWDRTTIDKKTSELRECIALCATNDFACHGVCFGRCADQAPEHCQGLATKPNQSNLIADLDGNGHPDLVFAGNNASRIYWGPWDKIKRGFSSSTELGVAAAVSSHYPEPGSVRDRSPSQIFTSRVHQAPIPDPEILSLAWEATVPPETRLRLQLRSAASEAELVSAPWSPLFEGTQALLSGQRGRFLQYRALLEARTFASSPVLDRVVIRYR